MAEKMTFHFEGSLADSHQMNFYEAARFQYAAARLTVKLAQFRASGRFVQKIHNVSNLDIRLVSQDQGSFNIIVDLPEQDTREEQFIRSPISDLVALVSERVVEKIEEATLNTPVPDRKSSAAGSRKQSTASEASLDHLAEATIADRSTIEGLPEQLRDLVRRRVAETYRENLLNDSQSTISRIDFARSQKLTAMAAPLISEMATALRRSADTLEVTSSKGGPSRPVLFLDQQMAKNIETAIVDEEITPIQGDIAQFNKENGWGKFKIGDGIRTVSFSVASDVLPGIRQKLIDGMKGDKVYLQTYYVRDRSKELTRLVVVGVLPPPPP